MAAEDRWEVRWLFFEDSDSYETVNARLREITEDGLPGWEPFSSRSIDGGRWLLLVRRKVES